MEVEATKAGVVWLTAAGVAAGRGAACGNVLAFMGMGGGTAGAEAVSVMGFVARALPIISVS